MGQGDRHLSDQVATEAMRETMDTVPMRGTIVIGEGEHSKNGNGLIGGQERGGNGFGFAHLDRTAVVHDRRAMADVVVVHRQKRERAGRIEDLVGYVGVRKLVPEHRDDRHVIVFPARHRNSRGFAHRGIAAVDSGKNRGIELAAVFLVSGLVGFEAGFLGDRHQFGIVD